jgi:hypothetical protein
VSWTTAFQIESDAEVMFSPSAARKLYFRDSGLFIYSPSDGTLQIEADNLLYLQRNGTDMLAIGTGVVVNNSNGDIDFRAEGQTDTELFVVDASGDGVGIGTGAVPHGGVGAAKLAIDGTNQSTAGPHMQFTTSADDYPLMQLWFYQHDQISIFFDTYWDGATKSSDAGSNFAITKVSDYLRFDADTGIAAGNAVTWTTAARVEADGEWMFQPGSARKVYWRDAAIHIASLDDGHLDLTADTIIDLNAPTLVAGYGTYLYLGDTTPTFALYASGAGDGVMTYSSQLRVISGVSGNPTMTIDLDWQLYSTTRLEFNDDAVHIASLDDGHLDLTADTSIDLNAKTYVYGGSLDTALVVSSSDDTARISLEDDDTLFYWIVTDSYMQIGANASKGSTDNITIDASGNLGIGTVTVPHAGVGAAKLAIDGTPSSTAGPHMQFTASSGVGDEYPLLHILPLTHDGVYVLFDAYYDGAIKSSDAGSNFRVVKASDQLNFDAVASAAAGSTPSWTRAFYIEADAEVMFSPSAARKLYFRDSDLSIHSSTDGDLDLTADGDINLNAPEVYLGTASASVSVYVSGATDGSSRVFFGEAASASVLIEGDYAQDEFRISLDSEVGRNFIITDYANKDVDHGHAPQTNPTWWIHSANSPATNPNEWGSITYDQSDFLFNLGAGEFKFTNGSIVVDSGEAYYMGDPDTNGTWRIVRSGDDLVMERRESGAYVTKQTITP